MIQIRKIEKADNEKVANMIRSVFIEHDAPTVGSVYSDPTTDILFEVFQQPKSVLFVAESAGEILGTCGIFPTEGLPEKCAELVKFYLPAQARGKGIGRTLMEKSIETAKEMGYEEIYLESFPTFGNAVRIYEKQGFEYIPQPLGNSGHTACTIWMLKKLNSNS